ncbi:MAG: TolC family protein [Thermodesulfovibrionales bacterium]|jgi:outer membrane protein
MSRLQSLLTGCTAVIVFSLFSLSAVKAEEYSLDELYRISLERSERIMISREDLYITAREKDRAFSALLPRLTAYGTYTQYTTSKMIASGQYIQPDHSTAWGLRLDQSFSVSGRELTAYSISRANIEKGRYDLAAMQESYLLQVANAYYDLVRAKKTLEIAKANRERLQKHRDAAEIRLKVGEVTKTDLLRAEAELSGAESQLIRAENTWQFSKAFLARAAGIEGDYDIRESAAPAAKDYTLPALRETALRERPELKSSEVRKKVSEDEVSYTKGAYWPTMAIQGVYNKVDNKPENFFQNKESIYGSASLNFPFFEGGLRIAEVRQAEARQRQAQLQYEDLKKTVGIQVESAYFDFQTQKGVLSSLSDKLAFAKDNYNSVSKQYEYGLANSIDVIDANTLLLTSESQLTDAQYAYQLSLVSLQRATGTFLPAVTQKGPAE